MMGQKGAAPITDIRAKRQAATLNVEDLPGNVPINISANQMSSGVANTQSSIGPTGANTSHQIAN